MEKKENEIALTNVDQVFTKENMGKEWSVSIPECNSVFSLPSTFKKKETYMVANYGDSRFKTCDKTFYVNYKGKLCAAKYNEHGLPVSFKPINPESYRYGILPVIKLSDDAFAKLLPKGCDKSLVKIGEYPQDAPEMHREMYIEHEREELEPTGKNYTTEYYDSEKKKFTIEKNPEYLYIGSVKIVKSQNPGWYEVQPITWIVDEKKKMLISRVPLVASMGYLYPNDTNANYEDSSVKEYIDNHMVKEMFSDLLYNKEKEEESNKQDENHNDANISNNFKEKLISKFQETAASKENDKQVKTK